MKTYSARIIFKIQVEGATGSHQYDEQLLVIFAETDDKAFEKAVLRGEKESETFVNSNGQKVIWQFMGVTEITKLHQEDTIFLEGRTLEPEKHLSFQHFVKQQNKQLSERYNYSLNTSSLDH